MIREESGQSAHVVEDDGVGAFEPVRGSQATGVGEGSHARGPGGPKTVLTVLDHGARRGRDPHLSRGVKEQIRRRGAVLDFGGAEDADRSASPRRPPPSRQDHGVAPAIAF